MYHLPLLLIIVAALQEGEAGQPALPKHNSPTLQPQNEIPKVLVTSLNISDKKKNVKKDIEIMASVLKQDGDRCVPDVVVQKQSKVIKESIINELTVYCKAKGNFNHIDMQLEVYGTFSDIGMNQSKEFSAQDLGIVDPSHWYKIELKLFVNNAGVPQYIISISVDGKTPVNVIAVYKYPQNHFMRMTMKASGPSSWKYSVPENECYDAVETTAIPFPSTANPTVPPANPEIPPGDSTISPDSSTKLPDDTTRLSGDATRLPANSTIPPVDSKALGRDQKDPKVLVTMMAVFCIKTLFA